MCVYVSVTYAMASRSWSRMLTRGGSLRGGGATVRRVRVGEGPVNWLMSRVISSSDISTLGHNTSSPCVENMGGKQVRRSAAGVGFENDRSRNIGRESVGRKGSPSSLREYHDHIGKEKATSGVCAVSSQRTSKHIITTEEKEHQNTYDHGGKRRPHAPPQWSAVWIPR